MVNISASASLSGGPAKKAEKKKEEKDNKRRKKQEVKIPVKINKNNMEKSVYQVYLNSSLTSSPYFLLHFFVMAFLSGLLSFFCMKAALLRRA